MIVWTDCDVRAGHEGTYCNEASRAQCERHGECVRSMAQELRDRIDALGACKPYTLEAKGDKG